jgi:hypothetical protein
MVVLVTPRIDHPSVHLPYPDLSQPAAFVRAARYNTLP